MKDHGAPGETSHEQSAGRPGKRSQLKIDKQEKLERFFHRTAWYLSMPITVFAIILVLDGLLPFTTLHENVLKSFQEIERRDKRHEADLKSFVETDHYKVRVSEEVHLNFPYFHGLKPPITLYITPILRIPMEFSFSNNSTQLIEVPLTIHTIGFPLKWILLVSSLFTLIMKDFSKLSYAVCFLPEVLLATILFIIL